MIGAKPQGGSIRTVLPDGLCFFLTNGVAHLLGGVGTIGGGGICASAGVLMYRESVGNRNKSWQVAAWGYRRTTPGFQEPGPGGAR